MKFAKIKISKDFGFFFLFFFTKIIASPISVVDGGTSLSSATAYAVLCGGTTSTSAFQSIASVGTSGQILSLSASSTLPSFTTINREYAYVYTQAATQSITAGSAFLFDANGLISSGISHSTSSDTDQIIINTAGTYWFVYTASTDTTESTIGLTIDGSANTATQYSFGGAGGFQSGQFVANITAGQVIRVVNWSGSTVTITGSASKVAASIIIKQIS